MASESGTERDGGALEDASNWERARDWIMGDIAERRLRAGDRLPPEPEIQRACGVGRHSVRRAVAALAAEGLVSVEQGRGTFVRSRPRLLYRIGRRTRFRENLLSQGVAPSSAGISHEIVAAEPALAEALRLATGAPVHRLLRQGFADASPIHVTRSYHCATRFPDLGARRMRGDSVTEIYRDHGIADYHRKETMLYARLPDRMEARLLEQPSEQPVIVMCKTDVAPEGTPLGYGEAIWAAGRVRFALGESP